ncbi:uncharacterized protein C8R40DRAFT_1059175 [Lentinula edodes]|uniref:uncharacterized protein n=1 Tax=Lentinula edodes TaxID=5353 RepID=UPI001E8E69B0|nr:uncharacterized protein C8R40DRAFT_1059175 [Lentinula edodes]KAH7869492.1 hypothetical protein C8R40DRAFT_1059175 [Lentinula edodes]
MYEDEELSELSEEDELANDAQGSSTRKHRGASGGYTIQKALKPPRATTYTAQALYDQIHNSDIDLEPEYQRDVVWTKEKQTNLIDSILRNFYIPPIIFAVETHEDGWESKTCIDGKQRLTSIQRFMDGLVTRLRSIGRYTGEKLWFKNDPSESSKNAAKRKILPDKYRQMFSNKQVVCVEYSGLTAADERDIFQRVQLGMALTSAEKLHVITTPRARFIRDLLEEFVSETTLGSPNIPWDKSRGSDFRCISQAVYLMDKWPTTKSGAALKHAGSLPLVEKWLSSTGVDKKSGKSAGGDDDDYGTIPDAFAKRVKEAYSLMVSPIEMICFSLLIYVHGVLPSPNHKMDLAELSQAIQDMRHDVRGQHKDIRMNDRVGKTMIEFIQSIGGVSKGKNESISAPAPSAKAKGKRRRVSDSNIEEEDEDYQPRKRSSQLRKAKSQTAIRSKPANTGATSRTDNLAKARAAKAASKSSRSAQRPSPPNPQGLPSPSNVSDAVVKSEPGSGESRTPVPQQSMAQISQPPIPQLAMPPTPLPVPMNISPELMLLYNQMHPNQLQAMMANLMMGNPSQGMLGMQGMGATQ